MRPLPSVERLRLGVTPERVTFYLGPILATWVGLLLYFNTTSGVLDRQERVRGRDFLSFYVHGRLLAEEGGRALYNPERFRQAQDALAPINDTRPRYYPLYPPATALLCVPFSRLDYDAGLLLWWLVQAACFAVAAVWLVRIVRPTPAWQFAFLITLGAYTPVFSAFLNGQLTGALLLVVLGGFELHHRARSFWAGLVLSLLTLKPQLAVGPILWLLLRRDGRALTGFALGVVVQSGIVAAVCGVDVFAAYLDNTKTYMVLARVEQHTADHQHALAGIVRNLFGPEWADGSKGIHAVAVVAAAGLLWCVVSRCRRAARAGTVDGGRVEHAAVVLTMLLVAPHLLTYDLALLLPAMAWLWAPFGGERPTERVGLGAALYLAGSATPLYYLAGFSLVPAALAGGLLCLARWAAPVANRRVLVDTAPKSAYA